MHRRSFSRSGMWGILPLILALAAASAGTAACGKDSTGPQESVCTRVSMSSSGSIQIAFKSCSSNSYSASFSNITYDQFSRVISYDFDIACSGGSERYAGSVTSVNYNSIGVAIGWSARVNGQTCQGP